MQVNDYDFRRINLRIKELDMRLVSLEHELEEFKSWLDSKKNPPKLLSDNVESNSVEFYEPLTDNDPEE